MSSLLYWLRAITLTALAALGISHGTSSIGSRSAAIRPVVANNFPDPGLINVQGKWYAFATRTRGSNAHIQVATSNDFTRWTILKAGGDQRDALPELPAWVNRANFATWSPVVAQHGKDRFIMYFAATTTTDPSGRFHCIGYATANNILGPYTGPDQPFVCPLGAGGAIDPSDFLDPSTGRRYLVYKQDGNAIGHGGPCGNTRSPIVPTWLMLQELAADGITKLGSPLRLLNHVGVADDGIVEAPALYRTAQGKYILFFSSGCFSTKRYTVSYATADRISGPYTRQSVPLLRTGDYGLQGPGGAYVHQDSGNMVLHAYSGPVKRFVRAMYAVKLNFDGTKVQVLPS